MKFLFVHIAKTAGTSINSLFQNALGPDQCLVHVESDPRWIDEAELHDEIREKKYVSGHRTFADFQHKLTLSDYFVFSFLREPAAHLISHLVWIRRLAEEGERRRLLEHPEYIQRLAFKLWETDFASRESIRLLARGLESAEIALLDNPQVRYLRTSGNGRVSSQDVTSAKGNLDTLDFVGLVETFDSDFRLLCEKAKLESPSSVPRENTRRNGVDGLTANNNTVLEELRSLIQFDIELYQKALADKRSAEVNAANESEGEMVARIDRCTRNQIFGWARKGLTDQIVSLDVFVDDKYVETIQANRYRSDLKEKFGIDCAFGFEFSEPLPDGAKVSVKITSTREDVINSPYYLDHSR